VRLGAFASRIQHEMAEAVRRCAAAPERYRAADELRRIITLLSEYLRKRLGEAPYAITIKRVRQSAEDRRLVMVFRDGGQQLDVRAKGDNIPLTESPIYMRFSTATRTKRLVFIGDTTQMPALEDSFRSRAQSCGYRTVIGFPLRLPALVGLEPEQPSPQGIEFNLSSVMGFLSVDVPEVGALEGLLKEPGKGTSLRDDDREPRDDLDLFYGLADSIATILMLTSAAEASGTGENDERRVHDHRG
jgi:hypothetical protein